MSALLDKLGDWGIPVSILGVLGLIFVLIQIIGEIIELCGKTVPVFFKLRKLITKWNTVRKEKKQQFAKMSATLYTIREQQERVEKLLNEVNEHYSQDNITKRDRWMLDVNSKFKWIDERAKVYDKSVAELTQLTDIVKKQNDALDLNNEMTSELYKQTTRTQILDFSHKIVNARKADKPVIFSREEFRKIRKSYEAYEKFLHRYGGTNGEVDDAMSIIRDAESGKLPNIEFLEDLRD